MTLHEVDEAANRIREEVDADANIIFGSTFDATMQGRMRVSVVATGIAAMAAQQPAPNYLSLDMNRPMQTGQPALSRPVAPPVAHQVGRVAMPAAAMAPPPAPMAAAPVAPPPAPPMMAPAPMAAVAQAAPAPAPVAAPIMATQPAAAAEAPIAAQVMMVAPVEAPVAPPPAPVSVVPPAPVAATPAAAPVAASQRPLVDENDWRVSRAKPPVRTSEPVARPVAARSAAESRSPNLFQRITGAFATPKPATTSVAPSAAPTAEPPAARPAAENVVAVAPKAAARPAPAQASINLDVTERTKPTRDDDDLQIPAFLRRQAN